MNRRIMRVFREERGRTPEREFRSYLNTRTFSKPDFEEWLTGNCPDLEKPTRTVSAPVAHFFSNLVDGVLRDVGPWVREPRQEQEPSTPVQNPRIQDYRYMHSDQVVFTTADFIDEEQKHTTWMRTHHKGADLNRTGDSFVAHSNIALLRYPHEYQTALSGSSRAEPRRESPYRQRYAIVWDDGASPKISDETNRELEAEFGEVDMGNWRSALGRNKVTFSKPDFKSWLMGNSTDLDHPQFTHCETTADFLLSLVDGSLSFRAFENDPRQQSPPPNGIPADEEGNHFYRKWQVMVFTTTDFQEEERMHIDWINQHHPNASSQLDVPGDCFVIHSIVALMRCLRECQNALRESNRPEPRRAFRISQEAHVWCPSLHTTGTHRSVLCLFTWAR